MAGQPWVVTLLCPVRIIPPLSWGHRSLSSEVITDALMLDFAWNVLTRESRDSHVSRGAGSAGYGKGCLSDFIRLEFDGLSSWSGPNIERLAIEHSVVKEQCASIANNRDAESRVHSEVR